MMAEAAQHERWNHTSALLALISNVNRDPRKGRAARPADFHPLAKPAVEPAPLKADLSVLKQVFVDRNFP